MADLYTNTGRSQADVLRVGPGKNVSGEVLMASGVYTVEAGVAVNDRIFVARLPEGARVVPGLCSVKCEALGTTFTVKVGTEAKSDAYGANVALAAAGDVRVSGGTDVELTELEGRQWVVATVTAVSAAAVGKKAVFCIGYVVN